jgi:hypothetical protein
VARCGQSETEGAADRAGISTDRAVLAAAQRHLAAHGYEAMSVPGSIGTGTGPTPTIPMPTS